MPFIVEVGLTKRLHPFAPILKDNRTCPPDHRNARLWVLWVGGPGTEKPRVFFCREVWMDGGVHTVYAPDAPLAGSICGQKVTVDAYLETTGRVTFTTEDEPPHLKTRPRHWSEALQGYVYPAGPDEVTPEMTAAYNDGGH